MDAMNKHYGDLYLALNPSYDCYCIRIGNQGAEGFRQLVEEEAYIARHAGPCIADLGLFHYHFSPEQKNRIPKISGKFSDHYFHKLLPELRRHGIFPENVVRLRDAVFCQEHNLPVMAEHASFAQHPDYAVYARQTDDPELRLILPRFKAWTAVETPKGVLLFSQSEQGERRLRDFMQYVADHFYNPAFALEELRIYDLPQFDPSLKGLENKLPMLGRTDYLADRPEEPWTAKMMADCSVLGNAAIRSRLDMAPTWRNYYRLTDPSGEFGQKVTSPNGDIANLLFVQEKGCLPDGCADTYPARMRLCEAFRPIEKALADAPTREETETLQREARMTAAYLLNTRYPQRRQISTGQKKDVPKLRVPSIRPAVQPAGIKP